MSRNGKEVLQHHVETMLAMDMENAPSDYSEELAAIARLDGHNRTLGYDSLLGILGSADKIVGKLNFKMDAETIKPTYFNGSGNYAVFTTAMKPFASFASFSYMIEDGKARYVSGYCKIQPMMAAVMPSFGIKDHPYDTNPETLSVMTEHLKHMAERDVEKMAADYAENAVILTNLTAEPLTGAEGVKTYCKNLVEKADAQLEAASGPDTKYVLQNAIEELAVSAFQYKKKDGVLTQRVQNGKIVFESLIFQDAEVLF